MPGSSGLELRRLAEVDRRLRLIQVGLEPFSGPAELTADADAAVARFAVDATPEERIGALSAAHEALRARVGRLEASVAELAGPDHWTGVLRSFERGLSSLPEVRAVSVREFRGADRVVVEVRLGAPTS